MSTAAPLLSVRDLVKDYQALRPLRIQSLTIEPGEMVSITGLDAPAAEVLVGLLTGALLPETGDVHLFGQSTRDVVDSQAWLAMLDGVGIVTDRAVLIGQFSVEQNAAMPYSLQIDPVAAELKPRVAQLVDEVGLSRGDLDTRVGEARPEVQARVRLARALALEPTLLLLEHPSASLPRDAVKAFAADVARVALARRLGVLTITADDLLARGLGGKILTLEPATGVLRSAGGWRKLFG